MAWNWKKIMQEKKQMEFIIRSEYCFLSLFALFSRNSYYYVNNVASVAHKSVLGCFTCSFKITLGLEVLNSFLSPKYLIKIHFFQAIQSILPFKICRPSAQLHTYYLFCKMKPFLHQLQQHKWKLISHVFDNWFYTETVSRGVWYGTIISQNFPSIHRIYCNQ